jgi:hypothetical protein
MKNSASLIECLVIYLKRLNYFSNRRTLFFYLYISVKYEYIKLIEIFPSKFRILRVKWSLISVQFTPN